jgi:hypothetical protein
MPYKNLEERRLKQKLQKQKKREGLRSVSPIFYSNCPFLVWKSLNKLCVEEIQFIENENIKYNELKNPKPIIRQSPHFNITVIPLQDKDKYKIENYKACCLGRIYLKFENRKKSV